MINQTKIYLGILTVILFSSCSPKKENFGFEKNQDGIVLKKYLGNEKSVNIPEIVDGQKVIRIAQEAFRGNMEVRKIKIPNSVRTIEDLAFLDCSNLISVSLPEDLINREDFVNVHTKWIFKGTKIKTFNIKAKTTNISSENLGRLFNASPCEEIIVSSKNPSFESKDGVLFEKNLGKLIKYPPQKKEKKYIVPSQTKVIGPEAFSGKYIEEVVLPDGLIKIESGAFANSPLSKINLPDSLETIEDAAFYRTDLTNILIPSKVNEIFRKTFYSFQLRKIEVSPNNPFFSSTNGILFNKSKTIAMYAAPGLPLKSFDIPSETKEIGYSAFADVTNLTSVNLPAGLALIEEKAFLGSRINKIKFGSELIRIGHRAFSGSKLSEVTFDEGIITIESEAFAGSRNLTKLELPNSLRIIEEEAFKRCVNLRTVKLSLKLSVLGESAFEMTSIEEIEIPNGVIKIERSTFRDCKQLKAAKISKNAENIEYGAFEDCESLQQIEIPGSVKKIGPHAFGGCTNLREVKLNEGTTHIGDWAFGGCGNLSKVNLPSSLSFISPTAFRGCKNISESLMAEIKRFQKQ